MLAGVRLGSGGERETETEREREREREIEIQKVLGSTVLGVCMCACVRVCE